MFLVYQARGPGRGLTVFCSDEFKISAKAMHAKDPDRRSSHFANCNAQVLRFADGEQLSSESFRKEDIGYAFRSGQLRFYGVYPKKHQGAFVLSHCVWKSWKKLRSTDIDLMDKCQKSFDTLKQLPKLPGSENA